MKEGFPETMSMAVYPSNQGMKNDTTPTTAAAIPMIGNSFLMMTPPII